MSHILRKLGLTSEPVRDDSDENRSGLLLNQSAGSRGGREDVGRGDGGRGEVERREVRRGLVGRGDVGRGEVGRGRGENKMLQLHENLSNSLYKDKDVENEKLSIRIVLFITVVATICTGTFATPYNAIYILLYLLAVWIGPMWIYGVGVGKKNSLMMIPWIFVFGVHSMAVEMFLLAAAVSVAGNRPLLVFTGTFVDIFLLVFLAFPLPILITFPVRAFIFLDLGRRGEKKSICLPCCGKQEKGEEEETNEHEENVEDEVVEEEDIGETAQSTTNSSLIITSFSRLSLPHNIMTTVINDRFLLPNRIRNPMESFRRNEEEEVMTEPGAPDSERTADIPEGEVVVDLYDLGSMAGAEYEQEEVEEEEAQNDAANNDIEAEDVNSESMTRNLEFLPPSYSIAEGLDQLPKYSEVPGINRMRVGPYVMVLDRQKKNFATFKK